MQRIDGATAAAALPTPGAVIGTPGFFTDGNPLLAIPPTTVTPDWANGIQEEMMAVIGAAGLTPDKTNLAQLLAALRLLFGGAGSLGAGHWTLPGGLILQWGIEPITSGSNTVTGTVTFPIAWPTGAFGPPVANAIGVANPSWHPIVISFELPTLTSVAFYADTTTNTQTIAAGKSFFWIALGH